MTEYSKPNLPAIFTESQSELREFDRDLVSVLSDWDQNLQAILDRGFSIADNWDARVVTFTSNAVADTEDIVAHTLGKIPTYFIVADIDKGGVVYRSGTTFTATNVYLKTSVATASVTLILL